MKTVRSWLVATFGPDAVSQVHAEDAYYLDFEYAEVMLNTTRGTGDIQCHVGMTHALVRFTNPRGLRGEVVLGWDDQRGMQWDYMRGAFGNPMHDPRPAERLVLCMTA